MSYDVGEVGRMGGYRRKGTNWSRVVIDVCTQRDFLDAGAILGVADRESLIARLRAVIEWATEGQLAVVSLIESHRPTEPIHDAPLHCIDDTPGQRKLDFTLLEPRILIETDNYLSLPPDLHDRYRQLIFRKRTRDILGNPKADRFLTQLQTDEVILIGVGLERAIKALALGLLARHHHVTVVTDACGQWSQADGDLAIRQLGAKGVNLLTVEELIATPATPPVVSRFRRSRRRLRSRRHHPVESTSGSVGRREITNA
ncbi:MAG TPA: isochorismatase family protein [Phycisphaerae bacterium]|nr:isochorismatase family protein [Phycisphaerae bacterium]HSA29840.1 isochorismatase family protein [Phycisphaerae bacterium]